MYNMSDVCIARCDHIIDLGILLDHKLNMNANIDFLTSKARQILGFIKRQARSFNDPYITKSLYCALVRPILEYCCVSWNPFTSVQIDKIESVQKQFLLFALRGIGWSDNYVLPPYKSRLALLNMDSLKDRRTIASASFMFKIVKNLISVPKLKETMLFNDSSYPTRRRPLLIQTFHSTSYGMNGLMNRLTRIVNDHSSLFLSCDSINVFKDKIREQIK